MLGWREVVIAHWAGREAREHGLVGWDRMLPRVESEIFPM
jgi:hypothetical protein